MGYSEEALQRLVGESVGGGTSGKKPTRRESPYGFPTGKLEDLAWKGLPPSITMPDGRTINVIWTVADGWDELNNPIKYYIPSSPEFSAKDLESILHTSIYVQFPQDTTSPGKLRPVNKDDLSYLKLKPEDVFVNSQYGSLVGQLEKEGKSNLLTLPGVKEYLMVQAQRPGKRSEAFMYGLNSVLSKIQESPDKSLDILSQLPDFPAELKPQLSEGQQREKKLYGMTAGEAGTAQKAQNLTRESQNLSKEGFNTAQEYQQARMQMLEPEYQRLSAEQEAGRFQQLSPKNPAEMAQADLMSNYQSQQEEMGKLERGEATNLGLFGAEKVADETDIERQKEYERIARANAFEKQRYLDQENTWAKLVGQARLPRRRVGI